MKDLGTEIAKEIAYTLPPSNEDFDDDIFVDFNDEEILFGNVT